MKKLAIIVPALFALGSCTKHIADLNVDPKRPLVVPSYTLFSNAQKNMVDQVTSSSVNFNVFRLIAQQWTETTYTDESNYNITVRTIPDQVWYVFYRDVLKDFEEAKKYIPLDVVDSKGVLNVPQQKNDLAITEVMEVYAYSNLVNTFGNIPYSQAFDSTNFFPKYDDAKTVYADLLKRLDAAIIAMNANPGAGAWDSPFGGADLLFGGDVKKWTKFANTLKLKLGMILADSDPATAKTTVESAIAAGVFTSNTDNAMFQYLKIQPSTNPIWLDLVNSQRNDFVPTSTLINIMKAVSDPRLPAYFTEDPNGGYSGGIPGKGNSYSNFSHVADAIKAPDFPSDLLDYAEVEFLLAEGAERGWNVGGGTAETHYNNGITASIEFWGGDAATYLANPAVAYTTATGTYKQKIGTQKWIALYNRGFDAYIEQRRFDFPVLPAPTKATSAFPARFPYPISEQNLNQTNYDAASAAIGGDKVTTKLFWDKF